MFLQEMNLQRQQIVYVSEFLIVTLTVAESLSNYEQIGLSGNFLHLRILAQIDFSFSNMNFGLELTLHSNLRITKYWR
jgi:hypothetical protein